MKTKEELEKLQAGDLYLTETVSRLMSEISERDTALQKLNEGCVLLDTKYKEKIADLEKRNAELEAMIANRNAQIANNLR